MAQITVRATREQIRALLQRLPGLLSGRVPDDTGLVQALQLRLGVTALMLVRAAFLVKATGGTDEAGDSWAPLAPSTIAGRRLGKADRQALTQKARTQALTPAQKTLARQAYRERLANLLLRGVEHKQAQALARAQAYNDVRRAGGVLPTRASILSVRQVEIMRDTGRLLNSLSPGTTGPSGNPDQVLRAEPGAILLGTNVKYGAVLHSGIPGRMPARRLWPEPSRWPETWWRQLNDSLKDGVSRLAQTIIKRGASG